jgi:NTP pyrophosphatase (non-canonical NTP hydrolase)
MSIPGTTANPDMSLRDLAEWAAGLSRRIAADLGLDTAADGDHVNFVLAQAVKLGEEVGELQAEVLGALRFQRAAKAGQYSDDTLGGELADVMVCVALLAETFGIDLARALGTKIEQLEARNRQGEITA